MRSANLAAACWIYKSKLLTPSNMRPSGGLVRHIAPLQRAELNIQFSGIVLFP